MDDATNTDILICLEAHAGPHGVLTHGEKVRADDPRVLSTPADWYVPNGTPESEWSLHHSSLQRSIDQMVARDEAARIERIARFEEAARARPVTLAIGDVAKAKADFYAHVDGKPATVKRGSTVLLTDALYADNADKFTIVKAKA